MCLKFAFLLQLTVFLLCPLKSWAQEPGPVVIAPKEIERINSAMKSMYDEILKAKPNHRELSDFDEKAFTKNELGLYTLNYEKHLPTAGGSYTVYSFGLAFNDDQKKIYDDREGYFKLFLPIERVAMTGYLIKHPLRRQFDFESLVIKYYQNIIDDQQYLMPLQLKLFTPKTTYHVGEPIHFKAVLANVSKHNVLVKGLGEQMLFITLNNEFWGTRVVSDEVKKDQAPQSVYEQVMQMQAAMLAQINSQFQNQGGVTQIGMKTKVGEEFILRANEALTLDFTGEGYLHPKDIVIRAEYQLNINGVKPADKITIKIIP